MENPYKDAFELHWMNWTIKHHKGEFFGVMAFILALGIFACIHYLPVGIGTLCIMMPIWLYRAYHLHKKNYNMYTSWEVIFNTNTKKESK